MRQLSRVTWLLVGGVAALLLVAGVDALRSSESETVETRPTTSIEPRLSAEQEIERVGNIWGPLFAGGDRRWAAPGTCTYMTPPACERIRCERQRRIGNCTPASWQFRRSFADATVVNIVIRGRQAGARFSNGETVEFFAVGEAWWIDEVGGDAIRNFFD